MLHSSRWRQPALRLVRQLAAAAMLFLAATAALAAGPRWVTGQPYFSTDGQPVIWYTDSPQYFTDPGDLSSTVNHAAADALVAAAAAVWNMPTSRLVMTQGGTLNEHVSGSNTYAGSSGIVFPADVQPSSYAAKQIAVIYDHDGSITDLLLGAGASDPSGCRQSAVTESVDSITSDGYIRHALLVLNGRCTGTVPAMQTQMQYQLMRAFGRILGLGWSQANDNVFTGSPTPTPQQAMHWPLMHPIDILCGPYSYQCLPQPFTPRMDDISAMAQLYFIDQGQAAPGKTDSLLNASRVEGQLRFPGGQGMQGVNVVGRRLGGDLPASDVEQWDSVSSVSGFAFRQTNATAVTGQDTSLAASMGSANGGYEGWYEFGRVDVIWGEWQWLIIHTEPVNPLYTGAYSVGPYTANTVQPSGANQSVQWGIFGSYANYGWIDLPAPPGAGATCAGSGGNWEGAPQPIAPEGWWRGQLCSYGWTSWSSLAVQPNRTLTIEVTAEDEQGFASSQKAIPVIGVWRAADPLGTTPTVAAVTRGLNTPSVGVTSLEVDNPPAGGLRLAIADQRGDGRPDFNFGARILYADTISPASVSAGGGIVTITGTGFRPGNAVTVGGVAATVQSWTSTQIVAIVPASHALGRGTGSLTTDVQVRDLTSGGTTTMSQALSYASAGAENMQVVSAPTGTITTGLAAATAFAVKLLAVDGVTPVAGESITFSASGTGAGTAALFNPCGTGTCTLITDANGVATTTVTPLPAGIITLTAVGNSSNASTTFTAVDPPPQMTLVSAPSGTVNAGSVAAPAFAVRIMKADGVTPVAGVSVVFSATGAPVALGACGAATCTVQTNASGIASTNVTPLAAGTVSLTAVAGAGSEAASFAAVLPPPQMTLVSAPSGTVYVGTAAGTPFIVRVLMGDGVTPLAGTPIAFSATVAGSSAAVSFGACGGPTCTVLTNASGIASSTVLPLSAGTVVLTAQGASGSQTASFTAVARVRTVAVATPVEYLAAGSTLAWTQQAILADNSGTLVGVPVSWTGSTGLSLSTASSITNAAGVASVATTLGPLIAGAQATATACAWGGTVCASFAAQGVDPAALQVQIVSGAGQALPVTAIFGAVIAQITDGAGHPVAAAEVGIHQTLEPGVACPDRGRCPSQPIEQQATSSAVTDANGLVSITPLDQGSIPEVTNIVVTAGTQGFASLALTKGW